MTKNQIVREKKSKTKMWQNSDCDKTQELKLWQNSKTQIVTKLKTLKLGQNLKYEKS